MTRQQQKEKHIYRIGKFIRMPGTPPEILKGTSRIIKGEKKLQEYKNIGYETIKSWTIKKEGRQK